MIRLFKLVLAGVVAVGVLIGLLLGEIRTSTILPNLTASIRDRYDDLTHRVRSPLNAPNDLVVDPPHAPPPPAWCRSAGSKWRRLAR